MGSAIVFLWIEYILLGRGTQLCAPIGVPFQETTSTI
ncbi:MAG: hypothetical protein CLLPBCKN_001921 [Chroococcidiopsis cubana SAG 39.79]|nr:hypothetical protein [Chroococcidiopsis cubana SAG 39.79]